MANFDFEEEKAVASLLFICESYGGSCDKYALLKLLYLSDRLHLSKYGRPITGDNYVTMTYGPVPSNSYDLVKNGPSKSESFEIKGNRIIAKDKSKLDELSETDIECIKQIVGENPRHHFDIMKGKTHDEAFENTKKSWGLNSNISIIDIAKAGGATKEMLFYIKKQSENLNCDLDAPSTR